VLLTRYCQPLPRRDFSFTSMPSLATSDVAPQSELKVPLYEASTQFQNWRFSVEQLAYTREALNEAATAAIRNTFENDEVLNFLFSLRLTFRDIARIIQERSLFDCRWRSIACQTLHHEDYAALWTVPVSWRSGGDGCLLFEAILSQKHRHGLAPKKRDVCINPYCLSLDISWSWQADGVVPCNKNDK